MKVNGKYWYDKKKAGRLSFEKIPKLKKKEYFRKRVILDGKVSGYGNRYDTLEQLLKEAKQLGHMNERKHEEVDNLKKKAANLCLIIY
jgi:hypothetical protein